MFTYLGVATDCYDGMRNWNQVRPAVFDGGYAFYTMIQNGVERPLPPGAYVVKVIVPDGYKLVKEEDKNVDFGDEYIRNSSTWRAHRSVMPATARPSPSQPKRRSKTRSRPRSASGIAQPAVRRRHAHRAGVPVAVRGPDDRGAVRRDQSRPLCDRKEVGALRPVSGGGGLLPVHLDADRQPLHGHDPRRPVAGVRPELAAVRREVGTRRRPSRCATGRAAVARLLGPVGSDGRPRAVDLQRERAAPERLLAEHGDRRA